MGCSAWHCLLPQHWVLTTMHDQNAATLLAKVFTQHPKLEKEIAKRAM